MFWIRSSLGEPAATMKRFSEPPHYPLFQFLQLGNKFIGQAEVNSGWRGVILAIMAFGDTGENWRVCVLFSQSDVTLL